MNRTVRLAVRVVSVATIASVIPVGALMPPHVEYCEPTSGATLESREIKLRVAGRLRVGFW